MDASQVISMVAETGHNLAALGSDETMTTEALDRCVKAADDLENSVALLLTAPWIPRDVPTLTASLQTINGNIKLVQDDIADKICGVINRGRADEMVRMGIAFRGAELLAYQREILMTTWSDLLTCPCGCGAFAPKGWIN